jgi:hypothetical protein
MAYMRNHGPLAQRESAGYFQLWSLSRRVSFVYSSSFYPLVLSPNNNWTESQMNGASSIPF